MPCSLTENHEEGDDDQRPDVFVEQGGGVEATEELDEDALGVAGHGLGVGNATADVVPGNIVHIEQDALFGSLAGLSKLNCTCCSRGAGRPARTARRSK